MDLSPRQRHVEAFKFFHFCTVESPKSHGLQNSEDIMPLPRRKGWVLNFVEVLTLIPCIFCRILFSLLLLFY